MGFDNECILNIQSLAGEYFCPVCRLLVNPNEALQSQCTHLYCKPCLAYIANSSRACPYDGYLVTESDAKPLCESNKVLADTINKIAVHCLYHRSGCTWQGPLFECITHCSGCAFGNSPVVCNRCGIQIVHRQVQEHAQNCPGVQPQAQQAVPSQEATSTTAAATVQSQVTNPAGPPSSQVQSSQIATTVAPIQDPKQQSISNAQVQAVSQSTVPTPEQWYQQQYQQYYQQYGGYDAYQQQYQHYYPYQQQAALPPHAQQPPQLQTHPQQPHAPTPANPQAPMQPLPSPQSQNQVQPQPQTQLHGQPQLSQIPNVPGSQPLNSQQQVQAAVTPHPQVQLPGHPSQPVQYQQALPQAQSHISQYPSQSYPQQHAHVPMYQQSQSQMQLPQPQLQGHPLPQQQLQPHPQAPLGQAPQVLPVQQQPQANPPLNPLPQSKLQPTQAQGVTGYQSYTQSQAHLAMQLGTSQQHPIPVRPSQPTQQTMQVQGQFPQASQLIPPPQSHTAVLNQQQPGLLPPPTHQTNVPPPQLPNYPPIQQAGQVVPQRSVMQSVQHHMASQISQQQQQLPLGGQLGSTNNQFYPRGSLMPHQLPMQSQVPPQGAAHPYQPPLNVLGSHNLQPSHPSRDLVGRPVMPTYGVSAPFPANAPGGAQVRPLQSSYNQNNLVSSNNHLHSEDSITEQQANMSQRSAKMDEKSLGPDASEKTASKSETDGKNLEDDHKSLNDIDRPGQTESCGNHTVDGLQPSENGEALVDQMVKDESCRRITEQLDGKVGKISVDQKEVPRRGHKDEENAMLEDRAKAEVPPKSTPFQQNELEGRGHKGSALVSQPPSSEIKALNHQVQLDRNFSQVQVTGFGRGSDDSRGLPASSGQMHAGGIMLPSHHGPPSYQQRPAASSLLHSTPPGPLPHSNAPGQILNQYGPHASGNIQPGQATLSNQVHPGHPPPPRMPSLDPLGSGVPHSGMDKSVGMMWAHKHPAEALETGKYSNQGPSHFDGRQTGHHLPGPIGRGLSGPPDLHSNLVGFGQRDERLSIDERLQPPMMDPSRRVYDRVFDEELKRSSDSVSKFESYLPPGRPFDGVAFDKAVHGHNPVPGVLASASSRVFPPYDRGSALAKGPFGPEDDIASGYGRHHMDTFIPKSPGREYAGLPPRGFGALPGVHNRHIGSLDELGRRDPHTHTDPLSNSFSESRFQSLPGHFRKSELEGNLRMGEYIRNGDLMGRDMPSRMQRGELLGPGNLPSHLRIGEPGGLSSFNDRTRISESMGHEIFGRHGEPGLRSAFSLQAYSNDGIYRGGMDSFDSLRKRRAISMGWCRICKVDCETVEGLDLHSQTREHQDVAMDMVRSIKQQNSKKQKQNSSDKSSVGDATKIRTPISEGHGNKL